MGMTNNDITTARIDHAIAVLETMRDRALEIELEMRPLDALTDFQDAWGIMLDSIIEDFPIDVVEVAKELIDLCDLD